MAVGTWHWAQCLLTPHRVGEHVALIKSGVWDEVTLELGVVTIDFSVHFLNCAIELEGLTVRAGWEGPSSIDDLVAWDWGC